MNISRYQWSVLKNLLKQRFTQLSDDDLVFERGKESELFVRLARKTGKPKEEIARIIKGMQQCYLQESLL